MSEHQTILEIASDQTKLGDVDVWKFLLRDNNDVKLAAKTGFFTSNWLHLYDSNIKRVYIILSFYSTIEEITVDHITGIAVGVIYSSSSSKPVWVDWLWSDPNKKVVGRGTSLLSKLEEKLRVYTDTIYVISLNTCVGFYFKYGYQPIKYVGDISNDIFSFSKPCTWQLMAKGDLSKEIICNDLHRFS